MSHLLCTSVTMTTLAKAHLPFFELVATVAKKQCKSIMQSLSKEQVNAISEVLLNVRYGQIELTEEDKNTLKRKKSLICLLTTKKTALKVRRAKIAQHSTFISKVLNLLIDKIRAA